MNIKKYIYMAAAATTLTLTACDDYVDITPTGQKTVDDAQTYLDLVELPALSYYASSIALLTDNDWTLESKVIGNENLTVDGINMTFNEQADRNDLPDNNLYANCYKYIMRQNIVIGNVDGVEGTDSVKALAKSEARVMRAMNHFMAVNIYAKGYNPETAASDGGVPIMGEYDLEAEPSKATVAQVYDFVISELEQAVPGLAETPQSAYHPSKAYGYALLSQVYLFHHDWEKARDAAKASLALKSDLADYNVLTESGNNPTTTKRVYGYQNGVCFNPEVLMYMCSGSLTENPTYIPGSLLSPELVQLFTSDDLRFSLFFNQSGSAYYYDAGSGAALWNSKITATKFFANAVGTRTAEVYLNLAEAEARLGNLEAAMEQVNTLRRNRIAGDGAQLTTPSSVKETVELVITERRKELLMGFHRFFDLKRLNQEPEYAKTITRTFPLVSTAVPQQTYTLAPDSKLYIIPFPKDVRDQNPNITNNFQ